MNRLLTALVFVATLVACHSDPDIMIEAESFAEKGGWVLDNQSAVTMGSPYLLAHGMGIPVADAKTTFEVGKAASRFFSTAIRSVPPSVRNQPIGTGKTAVS